MVFSNYHLKDLSEIARKIIQKTPHKNLFFNGEMGVGKTTLIKFLAKQLGVVDEVSSPTFSIVNEYETSAGFPVYHFDFYRIENPDELYEIGIENYFHQKNAWSLIEWADRAKDFLPPDATVVKIKENTDGTRTLSLK